MQITTDELSRLLQHSIGSGLSLNSRCMLLWINAASFCVSLLTRDRERLSGILSNTSSRAQIEEHCVSQLRHLWKFMRNNMQLTDEELSYLVMMCMRTNLQVCVHIGYIKNGLADYCLLCYFSASPQCWTTSREIMSGIFKKPEKVAVYERQWHTNIFLPCLKNLRAEVL